MSREIPWWAAIGGAIVGSAAMWYYLNRKDAMIPPPPSKTRAFDYSNNGTTQGLGWNEEFTLTLSENPSTGLTWFISFPPSISVISDTYVATPTSPDIVGSGGSRIWRMKMGIDSAAYIYAVLASTVGTTYVSSNCMEHSCSDPAWQDQIYNIWSAGPSQESRVYGVFNMTLSTPLP